MVFGGIIQHTGTVEVLSRLKLRVTVPPQLAAEAQLGDSIAINGVCLTVVAKTVNTFDFDLSEETVSRTTLSKPPAVVHVEAALKLSDAVGGHLISGHVHNVGTLVSLDVQTGDLIIELPPRLFPQRPVFKDSIAIDGVSLTVAELLADSRIRIALIPHTMKLTLFTSLAPGSPVNVELNAATTRQLPAGTTTTHGQRQPGDPLRGEAEAVLPRDDAYWMRQAIAEGEKSRYTAPPNPWVGAVLVDPWGTHIASGRHVRPGEPHAERMITQPMEGCTLYVTLEPCCHYGRTPPCVEYLVEKRPARVVVGTLDPDSRVRGQGVAALRAAGIDVLVGVAEDDVRYSLRAYLWHRQNGGQPYVVCKLALSQDNCFAYKSDCVEKRSWITGIPARKHSHGERAGSQRLVVGKLTSIMDKPQLTVRYGFEVDRQPEAVVSTRDLAWARPDAEVLQVLVEGGPELEEDLLRRRMVNEFLLYRSTKFLGLNGVRWMPSFANDDWRLVETKTFEDGDTMQRFVLKQAVLSSPRLPLAASTTASAFGGDTQLGRVGSATRGNCDSSVSREQRDAAVGDADNEGIRFDTLKTAIAALQRGDLIIVMDDANRENEGDLMVLADRITLRTMKFLLAHTTGIVCATMTQTRATQLGLPLMVAHDKNSDPHRTKFTVSVDAAVGVTTGVSAADRLKTLSLLASTTSNARDFNRPGHIFPLVAAPGGLLQRRGHTEAGVELARLAGMTVPVMAISELYDASTGRMMTRAQCRELGFPMITIDTILGGVGSPLWATVPLQQHAGNWKLSIVAGHKCVFLPPRDSALPSPPSADDRTSQHHPSTGDMTAAAVPTSTTHTRRSEFILRIHSECFTGDVLGSSLCDCGNQLHAALDYIAAANESTGFGGMIVFPPEHEGRGIGLEEKVKVYALQREKGMDTFAANQALGHPEDARDFSGVVWVLQHLGIRPDTHHISLLTENPAKLSVVSSAGYHVRTVTLSCAGTPHNVKYLADKRERFSQQQREQRQPSTESLSSNALAAQVPHDAATARVVASTEEVVDVQATLMKQAPKPMALSVEERLFLAEWTVCVVQAEWHRHVSDILVNTLIHSLSTEYGIGRVQREFAPGSFELPRVIQHLARGKYRGSQRRVVFVAVGVLVKGDTDHYDLVARETTANLLRLQLDDELWIVNSVLGCHNMEQVEERCLPTSTKCVGPHMAHAVARLALVSRN